MWLNNPQCVCVYLLKEINLHNIVYEMIIINKIIWIMELHVLAMIGCMGFDMVKYAVEIS